MAKGKKYSDEVKEQAYALYATNNNYRDTARQLKQIYNINVSQSTVMNWIKSREPDELEQLRTQKKKDFIEQASEIINIALNRLKNELSNDENTIPVNQLTTAIGTLYDKRALAQGESTNNTNVEFKLPEGVSKYAE